MVKFITFTKRKHINENTAAVYEGRKQEKDDKEMEKVLKKDQTPDDDNEVTEAGEMRVFLNRMAVHRRI